MSGICGLFHRGGAPADREAVGLMLERLLHRGPDRQARWSAGAAALGHAMLQVTPESLTETAPHVCGQFAITADARLDNREELIDQLDLGPGAAPSDSILILEAWRKWDEACLDRLLGDFAFAIWDGRREQFFCACDPMGIKTLYYHLTPERFYFASEVKALLALPDVPRRLNELRIAEYLVTFFDDRAATFYEEINRLPGGSLLTVGRGAHQTRAYWSLDPKRELRLGSDAEYAEAFREIFTEAVRCRTRCAGPIASSLSGGLDSSSVACLARNATREKGPLPTFSLVFPGLPAEDRRLIDERPQIQAVLETGGFEPHPIHADGLSPMWQMDRVHYHLDHANCAPNLYLHWAMYDAASSRGARVFLDGFDGDSAVSHGFERLAELTSRLRWGAAWREVNLLSRHHLAGIRRRRIIKEYCVKPFAPAWAFTAWNFLHHRRSKADGQNLLISPDLKRRTRVEARVRALIEPECAWSFRQDARKYHISSISQALYSYTLEIADKAAAAFQIEARYPFFDRRVLEFCVAIPPEQKLAQGWNRWILRRAMQGILPPEVQWRPSKGNLSPNFNRRLLECERDALERVVLGDSRDVEPFVDPLAMRSVFREYQRSHSRSRGEGIQLFLAVNLVRWLRANQFV